MNSKSESLFKEHIIRCNVVNYKMMLEKRFSNNETLVENLIKNFPISSIIQKSKKKTCHVLNSALYIWKLTFNNSYFNTLITLLWKGTQSPGSFPKGHHAPETLLPSSHCLSLVVLTANFRAGLAGLSITVYNYFSLTSFAKLNAAYIPDIGLLSTWPSIGKIYN